MAKLNEILGTLPDGSRRVLDDAAMRRFLLEKYRTTGDQMRRQRARNRIDLYKDNGRHLFEAAIDSLYKQSSVLQWRKEILDFALFQNVSRRIVRETSTVYAEAAERHVGERDGDHDGRYQELQEAIGQNRKQRKVNRFGNLLNNVLVWPDVTPDGRPVERMVTPDNFVAIAHPNDPIHPVGYVVDQIPGGVNPQGSDRHYVLITEEEYIWLDADWHIRGRKEHGVGEMLALLYAKEEPDCTILDQTTGNDLVSAHIAVAVLMVMLLKHQKSGTKLAIATGDTSGMARGQPMDTDHVLEAPDGVGFQTLDLGANPDSYIATARAVIRQVAANHGISESVFDLSYQSSSGFEIELKRASLTEIRRDQILDFRPFEKRLARLWSKALKMSGHRLAFDVDGWRIDFGDTDTPQSPMERIAFWERLEELGMTNRVEMYLSRNREATREEAIEAVAANLEMRIARMRDLQRANASLFGPKDSANPPAGKPPVGSEPDDG